MEKERYNFKAIEKKWQAVWEKKKTFQVRKGGEKKSRKKFYILEMFPYPSASGLHMGHAFNYVIGDIFARFMRMRGFNVLYPMGYDSLGLPAENAATKEGVKPREYTEKAIKNFIKQQKALGLSYDWSRLIETHKPEFYKWDQWIFLQMFKKGLAYRKKASVNWCSKCKTVLANEQVHDGKCWRHKDTGVEVRQLEQWFFKITEYANELYENIEKLKGWPEDVKAMQKNWIGKSYGTEINFEVIKPDGKKEKWPIFTTRPDTIFGVSFMVISAQHSRLMEIVTEEQKERVKSFLKKSTAIQKEREKLEKEGVFTGSYAINPLTKEKIPIWAGNFVVAEYGSGMVMAVPAHDQRDWEFAKKYNHPIKEVIKGGNVKERAYVDEGILVNSGRFSGIESKRAKEEISKYIEKNKLGKRVVEFRLKDWLISRQRYWGTPIPIIYCENCGVVEVPESQLPVKLPEKVMFGEGNPLEAAKEWIRVKCPKCGGKAKRETDTMDTFVNSSWYFLRYTDPRNKKEIVDKEKARYWMPIDVYIGGKEHACMHLIYFRFCTKFLKDLGLLKIDEPALRLFNQGMVHGADGAVMSKSRGNVVDPLDMIKKYGADTLRLYLVSTASADKDFVWNDEAIEGSFRFVKKVAIFFEKVRIGKSNKLVESKFNRAIKEISENIENFQYNLAVIKIRELFDYFSEEESKDVLTGFLKMFSVFCPHIAEELWKKIGGRGFISLESWPKSNLRKIDKKIEKIDEMNKKLIEDINNVLKIIRGKGKKPRKVRVYAIPKEVKIYNEKKIKEKISLPIEIFSIKKLEEKDKKAKPGKPAIYVE